VVNLDIELKKSLEKYAHLQTETSLDQGYRGLGSTMTSEEARQLQKELALDPSNFRTIVMLLGYYFRFQARMPASATRQKYILWMIDNKPDHPLSGGPDLAWDGRLREFYDEAKAHWLVQIEKHPNNPKILANASYCFGFVDDAEALELLERAIKLDPTNEFLLERLPDLKKRLDEEVARSEWIRIHMQSTADELRQGKEWLQKYRTLPLAGEVFARRLELQPGAGLCRQSIKWLREHYSFDHASRLLAQLIECDDSDDIWHYCSLHLGHVRDYLCQCAPDESLEICKFRRFFEAILLQTKKPALAYKAQSILFELQDHNDIGGIFPIPTYRKRNRRVENFTAKWISMSDHEYQVPLWSMCSQTPCVAVTEQVLHWIEKSGGKCYGRIVYDALSQSTLYPKLFPKALRLARKWTRNNLKDRQLGHVYATLLEVGSVRDRNIALSWYRSHKRSHTAKFILVSELRLCAREKTTPSPYIVAEAKKHLRSLDEERKFPVLVGALLSAAPDEEVIEWARDIVARTRLLWLLHELLEVSPTKEIVALGLETYDRTRDSRMDAATLVWLLHADRRNKKVVSRAKRWLAKNSDAEYSKNVRAFLSLNEAER